MLLQFADEAPERVKKKKEETGFWSWLWGTAEEEG